MKKLSSTKTKTVLKGFTSIELLVSIAILAVVSSVGLVVFSTSQKVSRDDKRKNDLRSIQQALELYYYQNKSYPGILKATSDSGANPWISGLSSDYILNLPRDPLNHDEYVYAYASRSDINPSSNDCTGGTTD